MSNLEISIVIASNAGSEILALCLEALLPMSDPVRAEVIVVQGGQDEGHGALRRAHPGLVWRLYDERRTLAVLRQEGIQLAKGAIIAILDPFSVPMAGWLDAVLTVHAARQSPAVGGSVSLYWAEEASLSRWAVFLNEYGAFMPPVKAGAVHVLPGCNISFKRKAWDLAAGLDLPAAGFWKAFFIDLLEKNGADLWLHPPAGVYLNKPIPWFSFLGTRYQHGRCYAGLRRTEMPLGIRLLRALSAPLLPIVFLVRILKGFWPKKKERKKLVVTLPLQICFFAAWAAGEMVGYFAGSGKACGSLYY